MATIKLFKGSVQNVAGQHGYQGIRDYEFALQLKSIFPYSYIPSYSSQLSRIARLLGKDVRTVKRKINRLRASKMAYFEGDTLRFLSYAQIRNRYAVKNKTYRYEEISIKGLNEELILQPIAENIRRQERAIRSKRGSNQKAGCQSSFKDLLRFNPTLRSQLVDTTLLSQGKAASLLGYRSKASGRNKLKRLADSKRIELESNLQEISRQEFNNLKLTFMPRLLILGQREKARFYFCVANTVRLSNKDSHKRKSAYEGITFYNH